MNIVHNLCYKIKSSSVFYSTGSRQRVARSDDRLQSSLRRPPRVLIRSIESRSIDDVESDQGGLQKRNQKARSTQTGGKPPDDRRPVALAPNGTFHPAPAIHSTDGQGMCNFLNHDF